MRRKKQDKKLGSSFKKLGEPSLFFHRSAATMRLLFVQMLLLVGALIPCLSDDDDVLDAAAISAACYPLIKCYVRNISTVTPSENKLFLTST